MITLTLVTFTEDILCSIGFDLLKFTRRTARKCAFVMRDLVLFLLIFIVKNTCSHMYVESYIHEIWAANAERFENLLCSDLN